MKRIAVPKAVPIHDKKAYTWMTRVEPGPHPKDHSIPLSVFLRDVIGLTRSAKESKQVLHGKNVEVDGMVRVEEKFPVGLMDMVSIPKSGKSYRLVVDRKGRLSPVEVSKKDAAKKLLRVVKKHTVKGGKFNITFHDGKNLLADNHIRVGDTVQVSLPTVKIESHLKRDAGCRCLIVEGKHAGSIVKLKEIIERSGGKPSEAVVEADDGTEFITVAGYLFVVDTDFKLEGESA